MKKSCAIVLAFSFLSSSPLWAAEEGAPQEAPFIQEDTEFKDYPVNTEDEADALAIEKELQNAQEQTVDLNDQQDSEKNLAEELKKDEIPVEQADIVAPAPKTEEIAPPVRRKKDNKRIYTKDGINYIEHPLSSKGLVSIRKDGSYVYRTKENTNYSESGVFRLAMMDPPRITAEDGTTYEQMYKPGSQAVVFFDYEWQPFNKFGKWGVQAGLGLLMASGNGRYADPAMQNEIPNESYSFFAIPLNLGVVYRMEWTDRQWFAPYVSGGGTYIGIVEARDDGKTSTLGAAGAYGAGGLLINISAMDRQTAFTLNTEYGIKNLWVALEYRYMTTFSENVDFSSNIIGAGVAVDY